ncbi:ABC-2 type transport system permease protein [Dysgonomonas sp. PH5-45]|uniref:ABC transporter permease n=1 Tax=unclassified Dysgonomonas TaxID=2630389 RepID=UPI002475D719|nr:MULTISPECIES: ABC transporter permease [unclassified Dysgonomonas]MDH6354843.1 ABC-2 type transport system permease protein [Dysgonomonas sp. PH5-45]MDH6387742.1 ABC-2 type transport system permease protein [Dysgonomonas sp. PH5-37]
MKKFFVDIYYVWWNELKVVFKDPAVILLFFIVPLAYPLIYAYIYNNEVAQHVPIVAVDDSRSAKGREFIRMVDASPDVNVVARAANMEEAREMLRREEVYSILYLPNDFSKRIGRTEQVPVFVYADMSSMLFYKASVLSVTEASLKMGADIRVSEMEHGTQAQDEASMQAVKYEWIPFYNTPNGFASFFVPAVLILIIQQTLVLGISTLVGTHNDRKTFTVASLVAYGKNVNAVGLTIGKAFCYSSLYLIVSVWILRVIPYIFNLPQIGDPVTIMAFVFPYLLAATFFSMTISYFASQREFSMLLFTFTSVLLIFLTGISWPWTAMPGALKAIAYIFPSTPGVHAFVKINTMGATLYDVGFEITVLWIQTLFYCVLASLMYRWWIRNYDPRFKGQLVPGK